LSALVPFYFLLNEPNRVACNQSKLGTVWI
jgi:hypothetical protein